MPGISEADYGHWREHGYVTVQLLDDDLLAAALDDIHRFMPPWEEYVSHPRWFGDLVANTGGPGETFPYAGDALNATSLHPELVAFAERVLRTDRIMLAYYTDVTIGLSPTYVVSQQYTRTGPIEPRHRRRADFPELYEKEIPVVVPAGWAVIYSMNTFHRGSALTATEGARFAQNVAFKRVDSPWCGQVTFQHDGGTREMDHFLENATPRQREFVGFPPVGDAYWNASTVANVGLRYPGMDMTPYAAKAG